jgi:diadenosine tetraphosphatase ApaH/serine/threonine PP2A family protein phosphatase
MLIALLADIHANREALTACLADAEGAKVDRYVFLGDLVGYGADPDWVVDRVARLVEAGAVVVRGNHDAAVADPSEGMVAEAQEAISWTRSRLDEPQKTFLANLPLTVEEGDRLFVHASACAPDTWIYILGAREAEQSLMATNRRLTFCGHTHFPALFHATAMTAAQRHLPAEGRPTPLLAQRRWLAVLGSVGQPRDRNPAACYGLLDDVRNTLTYVRVPYDADLAARKIRTAGLPEILAARLTLGI